MRAKGPKATCLSCSRCQVSIADYPAGSRVCSECRREKRREYQRRRRPCHTTIPFAAGLADTLAHAARVYGSRNGLAKAYAGYAGIPFPTASRQLWRILSTRHRYTYRRVAEGWLDFLGRSVYEFMDSPGCAASGSGSVKRP